MTTDVSKKPRVSVLVPIKDGQQHIARKISELEKIEYSNLEIIISINKSLDQSVEMARELCLSIEDCKLFVQETSLEIAKHFSFLAKEATGSLIVFSAVDDSMSPDFLEEAVELLQKNPESVAVSALAYYKNNSHGTEAIYFNLMGKRKERLQEFREKSRVSHALFYCLTSKTIVLEFSERYPREFIGRDWIFNLELLMQGKVLQTSRAHILFGEAGVSRQKDTFKLQTDKSRAPIVPYRILIATILRMAVKEMGELTIPLIIFAMGLLKSNVHRAIKMIFVANRF
jgi:GT2 family glycosyltransferase